MLKRLRDEDFDLVVIGGGITGCGVALDAAARGLRVALVERDDVASGTSSKSSKLVHGGLRYLQQGDVRLVYEALRERQRIFRNAPHLVSVLPFMIPVLTKDGVLSRRIARAFGSALWMYDFTGGLRIGRVHRRIRASKALERMPTMPAERLAAAYIYYDAQADDARLCLEIARTAVERGAVVVTRCAAAGLVRRQDGTIEGLMVTTSEGETFTVRCRAVVAATGVWADAVDVRPAKGVHVSVPWEKIRNRIAVVIPVPKDRRSLFVVPWGPRADGTFSHAYVGTTDTDHRGPLDDPQCTSDDIEYVLRALRANVSTEIGRDDITGVWAGLRPLVRTDDSTRAAARTADLSRRHLVHTGADGIVTVTGGKLTTYREMAEDAVDAVMEQLGRRGRCRTRRLRLSGAGRRPPGTDQHLWSRHGTRAAIIDEMIARDPSLAEPLVPGLPYLRAEAVQAVVDEMATTLDDVLSRRTRALLFDRDASRSAARSVAELIAPHLGWSARRIEDEIASFHEMCDHEEASALVTEEELHPVATSAIDVGPDRNDHNEASAGSA